MLLRFFVFFISLIILLIVFTTIKIGGAMWRFMEIADAIVILYESFTEILLDNKLSKKQKVEISYGRYNLRFTTIEEACIEFQKLVYEALEKYERIAVLDVQMDSLKNQKEELIRIFYEIRRLS